jgi:hypothetical protein
VSAVRAAMASFKHRRDLNEHEGARKRLDWNEIEDVHRPSALIDAPVTVPHLLLSCGDLPQEWADSLRKLVRVVVIRRVRARRGGDLHA